MKMFGHPKKKLAETKPLLNHQQNSPQYATTAVMPIHSEHYIILDEESEVENPLLKNTKKRFDCLFLPDSIALGPIEFNPKIILPPNLSDAALNGYVEFAYHKRNLRK